MFLAWIRKKKPKIGRAMKTTKRIVCSGKGQLLALKDANGNGKDSMEIRRGAERFYTVIKVDWRIVLKKNIRLTWKFLV